MPDRTAAPTSVGPAQVGTSRRFRRSIAPVAVLTAVALSATGATASAAVALPTSLSTAAISNATVVGAMNISDTADPDVFYDLEGTMVTNSAYESLVVCPPGSVAITGLLAKSWTISTDGLTYTFHLRTGIRFADGTPITSTDVEMAFQRRTAINSAPAYMLAEVGSYATPDPSTFVIHLTKPVNSFMSRLASPWAPMATEPSVIAAQTAKGDKLGATYLKTHSAGSGPYVISSFVQDQEIILTRNENYWGPKPYFKEVDLKIIPSAESQLVQMQAGSLDFIEGVNPQGANELKHIHGLVVTRPRGFNMTFLQVNSKKAPLSPQVMAALPKAIPYRTLVSDVFDGYSTLATQTLPANRIPARYAPWNPPYNPGALKAAFQALPAAEKSVPVHIVFQNTDNGVLQRMTDYLSRILQKAGFKTAESTITISQYFGYIGAPANTPNLVLSTQPDDGTHPDNWYRTWMDTTGPLNVGGAGSVAADALFDKANGTPPSQGIPYSLYAQGGKIVTDAGQFIPIANSPTVWVTKTNVKGLTVRLASDDGIVIQDLTRS